jgi:hypothetical protein
MTVARNQIVDVLTTRYYHCISKVVRGAFLMGDGYEHRKVWVEKRLELLFCENRRNDKHWTRRSFL